MIFFSEKSRLSAGLIVRVALLTAAAVLIFQLINLLVLYRYVRQDYLLCLVAASFLAVGWLLKKSRRETSPSRNPLDLLSVKEGQIFKLLAEGKTNKEIAAIQFVELSTVKTNINNIYSKLSLRNRREAQVRYPEWAPEKADE